MVKYNVVVYSANVNPDNPVHNDPATAQITIYVFSKIWDLWFRRWNNGLIVFNDQVSKATIELPDLPEGLGYTFKAVLNGTKKTFVRTFNTEWAERNVPFNFP